MKFKLKMLTVVTLSTISSIVNVFKVFDSDLLYDKNNSHGLLQQRFTGDYNKRLDSKFLSSYYLNTKGISNTADVVVNSDKKINYLYKIFYNKFLENPDKSIQESSKDEFSTRCDNSTSNFYLNGRKNSAHANGQYIGGIPYDKIADLYIEISYSNDNIKKFKLNLTSAVSTVTKNTQIKLGTEYFSIKATGSKDDPSIALYKNYNDFFTNHKISIQIGSFTASNANSDSSHQLSAPVIFGIAISSLVVVIVIVCLTIQLSRKFVLPYLRRTFLPYGGEFVFGV